MEVAKFIERKIPNDNLLEVTKFLAENSSKMRIVIASWKYLKCTYSKTDTDIYLGIYLGIHLGIFFWLIKISRLQFFNANRNSINI